MLTNFDALRSRLGAVGPKTLVVTAAHDAHTLEAVYAAAGQIDMRYKLVGNREVILSLSRELGHSPDEADIIDAGDNADCARTAVRLVREGQGDVLMKGILDTGTLLKAVLDREAGIRGTGTMSHLAVLESPHYHKLIAVTDGGMIPYPTLEQKADIVDNAVAFYRSIGVLQPKVAVLAASEAVSDKIPETGDAAALAERYKGSPDCLLEGPLSFDLAISRESADIKGFKSAVSGDADILLMPGISAGNILSKGLIYLGGARMAGCVLGAKAPIVLVSRGATAEEKFLSILLCLCGSTPPQTT